MRGIHGGLLMSLLVLAAPMPETLAQETGAQEAGTRPTLAESAASSPAVDLTNGSVERLLQRLDAVEAELTELREDRGLSSLQVPSPQMQMPIIPAESIGCLACGGAACNGACGVVSTAKPKFPSVSVTGFFHLDAGYYEQSDLNRAVLGDIEDGLGFRRARLAAKGKVTESTSYVVEFDFAQAQPRFVDVWMQFDQTPLGKLRIGRYRQPFGMAELTSIRELPFLERSLQFGLAPFRQTGMMLHDTALDESLTWAISGYRYLSDNYGNVYADTGGYGLAARLTGLVIDRGDDGLVHLGIDYSYNDPGRDSVQYASTNEFFVGQNPVGGAGGLTPSNLDAVPFFLSTGPMAVQNTNLFNLEGAIARGRLLVQSEARWAVVEHLDGSHNMFPGAYAHVRYMLTGETIPYNRAGGVFGRVVPRNPVDLSRGCWGAWEIAARASYLDLNGDSLPGPGRRMNDSTVGLNWYVNRFTKFQFNWIHADLDDPAVGNSFADTYALRGQLDF